ncbi:MAG TPA: metal-dependent transcriptional regulator, partial [Bryobacteraceae bacterium]|nr:metal-dependent transcriptional regulator [Bryobacteraceae bacterium]
DVLKYSWDEVHEEADRLEHFISERFEDRVAAMLNDPEVDPHGHVIPHRNGAIPFREEVLLARLALHTPATVSSVSDRDPAALRELRRLGLVPGVKVIVEERNPNSRLLVRMEGRDQQVRLNNELAAHVAVSAN